MGKRPILSLFVLLSLVACGNDTEERLSTLEAQVETLSTTNVASEGQPNKVETNSDEHEAAAFNVAVAQFIMDDAGFHEMEKAMNESGVIDLAFLGTVNQVKQVLEHTPWPADLADQAESFVKLLSEFAEMLEVDDAAAAASRAANLHEAQHDFSHSIDSWLGGGDHHD